MTDQPPPIDTYVLVWAQNEHMDAALRTAGLEDGDTPFGWHVEIAKQFIGTHSKLRRWAYDGMYPDDLEVTHWMPLPGGPGVDVAPKSG